MIKQFDLKKSLILIVDDVPNNIKVLIGLLDNAGYQTTFARSGKEALERLDVISPDLILLDLMMPEMSGLEVCERLKNSPKFQDIPIIFLTASHEHNDLIQAFDLGASDYVTKPFKSSELLARVRTHLLLKKQALELKYSEEKLRTIVDNLYDGVIIIDQEGIVKFANPAAARMFNLSLSALVNHELGIPIFSKIINEMQIIRGKNEIGVAEVAINSVLWEGQEASLVSLRDVSERQSAHTELQKSLKRQLKLNESLKLLATLDDITNIANRRSILNILKQEFSRSIRYKRDLAVGIIDIDFFTQINMKYSHELGDQVLYEVVKIILNCLRESDHVGRIGGDEFLVIFPETTLENALIVAERILQEVKDYSLFEGKENLPITVSIGLTEVQDNDLKYSELLKRSDKAMYQAKDQGRDCIKAL